MKTHRRICILTNTHPYGVTENFARHIAIGFAAHGFEPHIVNIMAPLEQQFQAIGALSAIDELFMIGALPLKVKVGDEYLWREMSKRGKRVTYYVIDSYHNDLRRVPEVLEYAKASNSEDNLYHAFADYETADAHFLCGTELRFGGFPAAPIDQAAMYRDRLLVFGGIGNELAQIKDTLDETVSEVRRTIDLKDDYLLLGDGSHWDVLSKVLDISGQYSRLHEETLLLDAYCALDAAMKRHRRLHVMSALKGLPIDIAGPGWMEHFGEVDNWRYVGSQPHAALGTMVQHYAGLINFDANWDWCPHDRALTAALMNRSVLTNKNALNGELTHTYAFGDSQASIAEKCEAMLYDSQADTPMYPFSEEHFKWTWHVSIRDYLNER